MANDGGGVSGGGEGRGGVSQCVPVDDLVEAMLSNSQALAEALAADRARREAADRVQRESWEAALKEKDAQIDRLRAEAADAQKKLQADASRKMGWEVACELLLNAAELRDADMEDSRTCAEPPNCKETESCTKLNQDTVDHIREQLRKLEQAYETLSSKKDMEVSALISEKDSVHKQLNIMQQDYTELLKSKKGLTQKKDHEIAILRAEADDAKRKVQKMQSLVKEKDDEIQRLKGWHVESDQKHYKDISETHKKSMSVDPAVTARDKLKTSNLRKTVEEDYNSETKTIEKDGQEKTTQKRRFASSLSNDCEMSRRDKDYAEQSESGEDGDKQSKRDEDGDKQSTSDKDGDEQSRSGGDDDDDQSRSDEHDEDEDIQSGSDKETTNNPILKPPGNHKRKRDACNAETANGKNHSESNGVVKRRWSYEPPPSPLLGRRLVTANGQCSMLSTGNWAQYVSDVKDSLANQPDKRKEFDQFLRELKQGYIISHLARTMKDVLDGHPELIRRFNEFLPNNWQIELKKVADGKGDEQSESDEDDGVQSGSNEDGDEQGRNDEGGDEQGRSDDVDGQSRSDGPDNEQHGCDGDDDEQTGSDEETTNNQVQKPLGRAEATSQGPHLRRPPSPSDSALKKRGLKKARGGPRKALMQKLREQIKGILLSNGWTIDLRPRKGRTYEDSVYVSPQGTGYWSITKAYAAYQEQLKSSQDEEPISKDDLAMIQRTVRKGKSQNEHSAVWRAGPVRGRGGSRR